MFYGWPVPEAIRHPGLPPSQVLLDRNGAPLREILGPGGVHRAVGLEEISPHLIRATLISEDRRFYWHPGIDPVAVGRSAFLNLRHGRVVAGGSSLTQQLVRNLLPAQGRGWRTKLGEAFYALRLEAALSKDEILELYLNRVPYGNQAVGIEAAARLYFERPAASLSAAQSAFLAVLPRAPGYFNPYTRRDEVLVFQRALLDQMREQGALSEEEHRLARLEPIEPGFPEGPFQAAHFCDALIARGLPASAQVRTTLDLPLQREVEGLLAAHLRRLERNQVTNGAVVVLSVEQGEILAMAGSVDYAQGQVNAVLAPRQPGSTLKPFTYALALERGSTPATLIEDVETGALQDKFLPDNYDRRFHGPVRLREALACSYNVSAVRVLQEVGVDSLLLRLRRLGFAGLTQSPEFYGLGLTLGDGEVTLLELARAYRALARGGRYSAERWVAAERPGEQQLLDPRCAYLIGHILADRQARVRAFGSSSSLNFPFFCAAKTGTSKGYRDNWTVGWSSGYVVAVWVGNFDARPMVDVSGITGAGPLFHDVMMALYQRDRAGFIAPQPPEGLEWASVCPASGELPGVHCRHRMQEVFLAGTAPTAPCSVHREPEREQYPPNFGPWMEDQKLPRTPSREVDQTRLRIVFPESGDYFRLDPHLRREYQTLKLRAVLPTAATGVEWVVDNERLSGDRWTLTPGTHRIQARARGPGGLEWNADPVTIKVQ